MKERRSLELGFKQVMWVFGVALLFYVVAFQAIHWWRTHHGPWVVDFRAGPAGEPELVVRQGHLGIGGVTLRVVGERLAEGKPGLGGRVVFIDPGQEIPFGEVIYEDLMSMPGVVTFNLWGHEVELLPRVLIVNKKEISWREASLVELRPEDRPAEVPRPPAGGTREKR